MDINENLENLQNKIIDKALIVFSIFSFMLYFFSSLKRISTGFDTSFYLSSINLIGLYIITILRKKLPFNIKIFLFLAVQVMGLCMGLYYSGLLTSSLIFMAVSPVFLSFLVSYRKALYYLFFMIIILVFFAFLSVTGILQYDHFVMNAMMNKFLWFIYIVVVFFTSWELLYVSVYYKNSLIDTYNIIISKNNDLIDQEKKYLTLFEHAGDAIILLNTEGVIFDANQMACDFFKVSKEKIIGKLPADFSPEYQYNNKKSIVLAKKLIDFALEGKTQRFEWQHKDVLGNLFDVSVSLKRVELKEGNYVQAILRDITEAKKTEYELEEYRNHLEFLIEERTEELAVAMEELQASNEELRTINYKLFKKNDIIKEKNDELTKALSELKEAHQQLVQVEKMASLGTLTAGVAHEINNPLNYLMGAHLGLMNYFQDFGTSDKKNTDVLLESISIGVERISNIVKGLNQFSRNNEKLDEICDIHSIIDNCLVMLFNKIKHSADIVKEFEKEKILVKGNVGKLHQVFINVLNNALQAITEQGIITIRTNVFQEKLTVEITDNGIGIEDTYLSLITDPFFTTKPPGEGTGLGLSITYSIVKDHQGEIKFESEVNKGTKVIIILPLWEG